MINKLVFLLTLITLKYLPIGNLMYFLEFNIALFITIGSHHDLEVSIPCSLPHTNSLPEFFTLQEISDPSRSGASEAIKNSEGFQIFPTCKLFSETTSFTDAGRRHEFPESETKDTFSWGTASMCFMFT